MTAFKHRHIHNCITQSKASRKIITVKCQHQETLKLLETLLYPIVLEISTYGIKLTRY